MTKNFFLTLAVTISGLMSAQESASTPDFDSIFKFGAKAGYSLSSMKVFDDQLDSKSYFYAGFVIEKPVSSKVGIQAEVLYTQLGGTDSLPLVQLVGNEIVEMGNVDFNYQFTQIQIPVSVKYYFVPKFSAAAGMNFGFNLSEKMKTDVIVNGTDSQNLVDYKTLNLFPFLGAEYKITDQFFIDARYNFNFFDTHRKGFKTKIGFLQAGVGYRFN
ncbi:porin family protein [Chryseobacterium caseinilyticum]|uniref:PorT family protein n=1 Tax=Chryseobacterium caseinilyticum TaxID=2771428 RepID=A0ABR8ZBP7_9FLAO|nr:porin family protein [Chryseobacterium caseinilyticum]MBD8082273.1 PorT family protein [Chryseobacterium caseinilyticum]